jgi:glucose/arabinose dehydrogenase
MLRNSVVRLLAVVPLVAGALVAGAQPAGAAPPPGFHEAVVARGLGVPTGIAGTPDGRLLVTEKAGVLAIISRGAVSTALDLRSSTCTQGEQGMESVTLDPGFAGNGFIYVFRTIRKPGGCVERVARFTLTGGRVAPSSEVVLLDNIIDDLSRRHGFHNGGNLKFGHDGDLYVSTGDGFCVVGCDAANQAAQRRNILNGKILRITASGGIPAGNPFTGAGTARCGMTGRTGASACQEVYALGLRNPFKFNVDPNAGGTRIFVNDTGRNTWEEIDLLRAGANYGWPVREGPCAVNSTTNCGPPPAGMTNPIFAYKHTAARDGTITGGAFVPNGRWSAAFNGKYLYGDFENGQIQALTCAGASCRSALFEGGFGASSLVALEFANATSGSGRQSLFFTLASGQLHEVST